MTTLSYARIYRLINDDGLVYYGSTTQKYLSSRLAKHKYDNSKNKTVTSKLLFEGGKDVRIELVENCEVIDKYELHNRERYYIQNNECVNKCIPNRTDKEYCQDNKEKKKEYYETNKEAILAYTKEYKEKNKEAVAAQRREYGKKNRETIAAYQKERYANKKISAIS